MRYSFHRLVIWSFDRDEDAEDEEGVEVEECEMVAVANAWARAVVSYWEVG